MIKTVKWSVKNSMACLFGLMVCVIITLMCLTKSINLNCFYDVGEIYDVGKTERTYAGNNWVYDNRAGCIRILEDISNHIFVVTVQQKNWNYLYLELDNLEEESNWDIYFLNSACEATGVVSQTMKNGLNVLELPREEIYAINIAISNQKGLTFSIPKMQFRERQQTFGWKEFWMVFAVVLTFYMVVACFYQRKWKKKHRKEGNIKGEQDFLEIIRNIYIFLLDKGGRLHRKFSPVVISRLRTFLFFLCYLIIYFMLTQKWRRKLLIQNKMVVILGICLLLISFLCWEGKKVSVSWRNSVIRAWILLWVLCIISDFLTEKTFRNQGIFMLVAAGPFYLSWNSMEKPEDLICNIKCAMEWFYWLSCLFCIFCRPYIPGFRYMGNFNNPNPFAGSLVTMNLVFLDSLNNDLPDKELNYWKLFKNTAGIVSIFFFLQLTQSITAIVVFFLEILLLLWKQFLNKKGKWKNILKCLSAVFINGLFMITAGKWCLINVANILNTGLVLPGDMYQIAAGDSWFSITAYAANNGITTLKRITMKFFSRDFSVLLTGRDAVWNNYIRKLNLFGHGEWLEFSNERLNAHNNLLQMMYDYGVFVALPYLSMLYYSLKYSLKKFLQDRNMSLFILGAVLNFHTIGLMEDVASPYAFASWLTFYLVIGSLFVQQAENVRR